MVDETVDQKPAQGEFKRHKYLSYQGFAFPWYATLIWIGSGRSKSICVCLDT